MNNKESGWHEEDARRLRYELVEHVVKQFHVFASESSLPRDQFGLDRRLMGLPITNAVSDMKRSVDYHSNSGPSIFKVAGFVSKWVAQQRPVWVNPTRPINLHSAALDNVNSLFAAGVGQSLLTMRIYPKLFRDLRYCFEYRRMTGDEVTLLLEHALRWSPTAARPAEDSRSRAA